LSLFYYFYYFLFSFPSYCVFFHSGDVKIADLVGEHLQTKEKPEREGRVGVKSIKGNREEGVDLLPPSLRSVF
jgi:hypothetical protein